MKTATTDRHEVQKSDSISKKKLNLKRDVIGKLGDTMFSSKESSLWTCPDIEENKERR